MFMTMRTHINNVLSSCYGSLRQIRTIKRSLPVHALNTLVTSLVCSRLDYCNVVFGGLSACDLQRLQSILNAAVRLVTNASRRDCITPLLCDCHWLPIKQHIDYKLCMMVQRCLSEMVSDLLHPVQLVCRRSDQTSHSLQLVTVSPPLRCVTFNRQLKTCLYNDDFN